MHRDSLPQRDIYGLFDKKKIGPDVIYLSTTRTEENMTRITLGEPCIAIEPLAYGTHIPLLDGKPIVGRYATLDVIAIMGTVNVNGNDSKFPIYLFDHIMVDPEERRRGYGMRMQELLGKFAKNAHAHIAVSRPNDASEALIEKFAVDKQGIYRFKHDGQPCIMVKLR